MESAPQKLLKYWKNAKKESFQSKNLLLGPLYWFFFHSDNIQPTVLYPTNEQVDKLNMENLEKLNTPPVTFYGILSAAYEIAALLNVLILIYSLKKSETHFHTAEDSMYSFGSGHSIDLKTLLDGCLATSEIILKVGAQVMLLRNISDTLVNGSQVSWMWWKCAQSCRVSLWDSLLLLNLTYCHYQKTKELICKCYPLRSFLISWIRLFQLFLLICWISVFRSWFNKNKLLPVVQFANREIKMIGPECFSATMNGTGEMRRTQIPLKLCYALTIHKSQGLTLERYIFVYLYWIHSVF